MSNEAAEPSQTAQSETAPQESVPENKETQSTPSRVEASGEQSAATRGVGDRGDIPKGLKKDLFDLRQKNRDMKSELEQLRQELSARIPNVANSQVAQQGVNDPNQVQNIFDNPDEYLKQRDRGIIESVNKLLEERLKLNEQDRWRQQEGEAAAKWLQSQSDFKDDQDAEAEIMEMLSSDEFREIAKISPRKAARLVYSEWRESKGLDRQGVSAAQARAKGVGATASNSQGPKTWTRQEVEKYLNELPFGHADRKSRMDEVLMAQKEGRIK